MSTKDYYSVLGVSRSATSAEIKKAYLKLAKKYHPDCNNGDAKSEQKFKEAGEAYDVLKDPQKKAAYDRFGHDAFSQGAGTGGGYSSQGGFSANGNVNDMFNDFFSDFMGGSSSRRSSSRRSSKVRGEDLKYNVSISLEEAFFGADKKINFTTEVKCSPCSGLGSRNANSTTTCTRCGGGGVLHVRQGFFAIEQTCDKCNGVGHIIKDPCSTCHGAGRVANQKTLVVNIPSGIENDTRIRISGEGASGIRGGSSGDLYVFVSVKEHDLYKVEGSDLHCKLPLSFAMAALGGELDVPLIDGSKARLKIPQGTETGDKLRLKGKGMSKVRSSMRGDLYTCAYIQTPKNLTSKQKDLLCLLDKELGGVDANYKDEGFLSKMKNIWS